MRAVWSMVTRLTIVVAALSTVPMAADAQRVARCNAVERVRGVSFEGSPAFDVLTLASSIFTHEPGFVTRVFRIGTPPCMDTLEVQRDALRLAILHRQAGWFQATAAATITRRHDGVRIRFVITPGREALLDTVRVTGLPEAVDSRRGFDAPLRALEGKRFDRTRVDTTVASVLNQLRDAGFARARMPDSLSLIHI